MTNPFLSGDAYPWSEPLAKKLYDKLVIIFPDTARSSFFAQQVGIGLHELKQNVAPWEAWREVLDKVGGQPKCLELLQAVAEAVEIGGPRYELMSLIELVKTFERVEAPQAKPKREPLQLEITIENLMKRTMTRPNVKGSDPFTVPVDGRTVKLLHILDRMRKAHGLQRKESEIFGACLFEILFGPSPRSPQEVEPAKPTPFHVLKREYENANQGNGTYLRIVLTFKEAASEIADLPWECIFVPANVIEFVEDQTKWPETGFYLMMDDSVTLSRTRSRISNKAPVTPPLSVLLVDARRAVSPKESNQVDDELAWYKTLDSVEPQIKVVPLPLLSRKTFLEALKCGHHVVHFIGDGNLGNDEPFLVIPTENGGTELVSDLEFHDALKQSPTNRLVILHACAGQEQASYTTFIRLANSLVMQNFPAVVALQQGENTNQFFEEFYRSLNQSDPVDFALRQGRRKLGASGNEFSNPVLFLQSLTAIVGEGQPSDTSTSNTASSSTHFGLRGASLRGPDLKETGQQPAPIKGPSRNSEELGVRSPLPHANSPEVNMVPPQPGTPQVISPRELLNKVPS